MKKTVKTEKAPAAIGPYSQAVKSNGLLYVSGQLGIHPETGDFVAGGVEEQTRQVFQNIRAILSEAGYEMPDIVKTTVYLTDMSDFAAVNGIYAAQFDGDFPARSAVAVSALPKNGLVEIEIIAMKSD
jgi:2-iminobutanoate/2-iminopropanoate deaminase